MRVAGFHQLYDASAVLAWNERFVSLRHSMHKILKLPGKDIHKTVIRDSVLCGAPGERCLLSIEL